MRGPDLSGGVTANGARRRRQILVAGATLAAGLVAGCLGDGSRPSGPEGDATTDAGDAMAETDRTTDVVGGTSVDANDGGTATTTDTWRSTELTDVLTSETFTIGGFDASVVLEIFAVWCPVCTSQQRQLAALGDRVGSDVALVSLNIDPNEDAQKVRKHATDHGFDWHYAVSPPELTKALSDRFGTVITNPPSAPVITVCRGGPATLLEGRGVKSAATIGTALEAC